jgi:uncharacterized protein (DUF885 family)
MRGARLVVDVGIHAFGWSREQVLEFMVEHVPISREFLASEIDRYTVMPGPGPRLPHRQDRDPPGSGDEARKRLGVLAAPFYGAVPDHGSLPMPTLARSIASWLDAQ